MFLLTAGVSWLTRSHCPVHAVCSSTTPLHIYFIPSRQWNCLVGAPRGYGPRLVSGSCLVLYLGSLVTVKLDWFVQRHDACSGGWGSQVVARPRQCPRPSPGGCSSWTSPEAFRTYQQVVARAHVVGTLVLRTGGCWGWTRPSPRRRDSLTFADTLHRADVFIWILRREAIKLLLNFPSRGHHFVVVGLRGYPTKLFR